jgi:hypothetical protein
MQRAVRVSAWYRANTFRNDIVRPTVARMAAGTCGAIAKGFSALASEFTSVVMRFVLAEPCITIYAIPRTIIFRRAADILSCWVMSRESRHWNITIWANRHKIFRGRESDPRLQVMSLMFYHFTTAIIPLHHKNSPMSNSFSRNKITLKRNPEHRRLATVCREICRGLSRRLGNRGWGRRLRYRGDFGFHS